MDTPEESKILKLPAWAQQYIKSLKRERDAATRQLNEFCDSSTPSPFSVQEMVCSGESGGPSTKTTYVQAHTIHVNHAGIELDVSCFRDGEIGLQWNTPSKSCQDIAFIPSSYMAARLVHPDHMSK